MAVLPLLKGKVCDLGCGPAEMYKGTNIDVTGVDFSEEAIREARINYPQGSFLVADARAINLPSGSFDTVIMSGLLDYFDDWADVLKEARRITQKDGIVIGTLLHGYKGHDWSSYPHLTGNWHYKYF